MAAATAMAGPDVSAGPEALHFGGAAPLTPENVLHIPPAFVDSVLPPHLTAPVDHVTASNPYRPIAADVNRDGHPDLLVPCYYAHSVSVLLGLGTGAFQPRTDFAVGTNPNGIASADLDTDGDLDIVTFNRGGTVSVLLNLGDGTFATHVDYTGGATPYPGAIGDVNGDCVPDLVYPNNTAGTLSIMLGIGDGTFAARTTIAVGTSPGIAALADFDRDGDLDVVVNLPAQMLVLPGNGDGTFAAPVATAAQAIVGMPAVGDFDGDGRLDVAWARAHQSTVTHDSLYVALGDGDCSFAPPVGFLTDAWVVSVSAADVNGDGKLDLVNDNWGSASVTLLLGKGDGSFFPKLSFPATTRTNGLTVADFNRDGRADVAVSTDLNYGASEVSVLLNGQNWAMVALDPSGKFATASNPYRPAIADLNGDGRNDVLVPCYYASAVSVLIGACDGTFLPRVDYPVGTNPNGIATADLDHDGDIDVVTFNRGGTVSVLLNHGNGTFPARVDSAGGPTPYPGALVDLNGDTHPDMAYPNNTGGTLTIRFGAGDGTFGPRTTVAVGPSPGVVAPGDVDGDGFVDLVFNLAGKIAVLPGNGDGTFDPSYAFGAQVPVGSPALGDLDGDGHLDIVWARSHGSLATNDSLYVAYGNGDFTFAVAAAGEVDAWAGYTCVADMNGDGDLDLVNENWASASVTLLLGHGDRTFEPKRSYPAASRTNGLAVGDLDCDGHPDVAVSVDQNYHAPVVSILRNNWAMGNVDVPVAVNAGRPRMSAPRPNPAPDGTTIEFALPSDADASLCVYDVAGRLVTTLARGRMAAGVHTARWDGRYRDGGDAGAGIYFAVLDTQAGRVTRAVVLVR